MADSETGAELPAYLKSRGRFKGGPIATEAELDQALAELAWLDTTRAEAEAVLARQVEQLEMETQQRLRVRVGRSVVGFTDRQTDLRAAVEAYATEHREQLLAGGKGKTRKLTHGQISWSAKPAAVAFADGATEDQVAAAIETQTGILARLLRLLGRLKLRGLPLTRWLRVKPALDRQQILAAFKAGELTADDLAAVHLQVIQPADGLSVKLFEYRAEAHSERVAA